MKNVLIAMCVTSYWLAVLVLLLYRASSPVLVATVLVVAGTTALGALAVCDAVALGEGVAAAFCLGGGGTGEK